MALVVVASSDASLRHALATAVGADDHTVLEALDGLEAVRTVFESRPDAALLDLSAGEVDPGELIRMLRAASDLAIVAVPPSRDPRERIRILEMGADDVAPPDTPVPELAARLRASMRRARRHREAHEPDGAVRTVRTGTLEVDLPGGEVTRAGLRVRLSRTERRLLVVLAERVGQLVPHAAIMRAVWGERHVDDTHYLRVYVGYLRGKLEDDPRSPRYILSEWGRGYRLAHLPVAVPGGERAEVSQVESL